MVTTASDQDAIRVANRYAGLIEKAATLQDRARACQHAARQYRRDALANTESAQNHRTAASTIRDARVAHQHTVAAQDAEGEAARETLAARYYEQQADQYQAQARGITPASPACAGAIERRDTPHGGSRAAESGWNAEQARATRAATDMTDDSVKDPMTTSADSTVPAGVAGGGDALPDTAGITGPEHWHASDVVTAGHGDGKVCLGLRKYPDSGTYVVVATKPAGQPWDPDSNGNGSDPPLSPQEAGQLADALDELVDLAQSGAATPAPTRLAKVAERVRGLLGDSGVTIIGDEGQIEVSAADIRKLLDAAAPEPAAATRHKVTGKACEKEGGFDTGTVWAQLDTSGPEPVIAVTGTEGQDQPEDYPAVYTTTRLSLPEARELAEKVRRFAQTTPDTAGQHGPRQPDAESDVEQVRRAYERLAAQPGDYIALTDIRDAVPIKDRERVDQALRQLLDDDEARLEPEPFRHRIGPREEQAAIHIGGEDRHKLSIHSAPGASAAPEPAAPAPAAPAGPRQVSSSHGKKFEYDPDTGATAVIEPDGWRAVVPPSSPTGIATRLLYWNAEIKDGRGDDATDATAHGLLAGLSAAELREVAENIGASAPGARTKAQLTDAIVNMTVSSARKHRNLRRG